MGANAEGVGCGVLALEWFWFDVTSFGSGIPVSVDPSSNASAIPRTSGAVLDLGELDFGLGLVCCVSDSAALPS